jgi:hypothetical protein
LRQRIPDIVALAIVFAVASFIGARFLSEGKSRALVEWELAPALMVSCGEGFTRPAVESPALQDFLHRRRPSVTCADVVVGERLAPLPIAQSERYAIIAAGLAMRVAGTSWQTLDAYLGALFGATMALAYGLLRQLVSPALAVAGVTALIWSNQVTALLSFRDFGKAPMFFAAWLLLAAVIRASRDSRRSRFLLASSAAGAVIGVGLGFRPDLMVCVPAFVIAILFVIPGFEMPALRSKGMALALFMVTLIAAGWPVLRSASGGSNSAHVVVLGLMQPFTQAMGIKPPAYDVGAIYSDTFAVTLVAAHAGLVGHNRHPLIYGATSYDAAGGALLADVARHFPADLLTRTLAATAQVLESPFTGPSRGEYLAIAPLNGSIVSRSIGRARDLALRWMEGRAVWLAVGALLILSWQSWQIGVWSAAFVLYFAGYSMLQFARRHTFHLDLIGIAILLLAIQWAVVEVSRRLSVSRTAPLQSTVTRPSRTRGVVAMVLLAATVLTVLWGARRWQQAHVIGMLSSTLGVTWERVAANTESLEPSLFAAGGVRRMWQPIVAGDIERWRSGVLFRVPRPVRNGEALSYQHGQQSEYLRVELLPRCESEVVSVVTVYSGSEPTEYREYTRLFEIPVAPGADPSRLVAPLFYRDGDAWTTFDGIAVPRNQVACVSSIALAQAPEDVPLPILTAVMGPDWRTTPWYQQRRSQ